jgi:hypothetical protein
MIGGGSAQNDSVGFGKINGRRQKRNIKIIWKRNIKIERKGKER